MTARYTMGIDIGSTASKCVILRDAAKPEIVSKALIPFGAGTSGPARVIEQALSGCGYRREDMAYVLATGYGRNSIEMANFEMSELSCHAFGAHFLFPDVRTVIDIGGQDVKVLRVGEGGLLETFVMNEKCAAGTGRFLEVMARVLEVKLEDLAAMSERSTQRVDISSTCTVFAESEVISQLAQNKDRCDIINGIHRSVAGRVSGLARRVGVEPDVVMTGGVAQNSGVLTALENELKVEIKTSPLSQYTGALGAALLAFKKLGN
ncbi:MAG: acyl-CoA dehydratase activase [Synergistaceae bacterium]|jgi:predicted CoA-substrate-specific enzyme activase|nr:acyl-CoA dehydratase activase [Synergistaceae bacterium]